MNNYIPADKRLSLAICKKILKRNDIQHTDEEIILIRDWFYHLTDIAIDAIDKNANTISTDTEITQTKNKGKP